MQLGSNCVCSHDALYSEAGKEPLPTSVSMAHTDYVMHKIGPEQTLQVLQGSFALQFSMNNNAASAISSFCFFSSVSVLVSLVNRGCFHPLILKTNALTLSTPYLHIKVNYKFEAVPDFYSLLFAAKIVKCPRCYTAQQVKVRIFDECGALTTFKAWKKMFINSSLPSFQRGSPHTL